MQTRNTIRNSSNDQDQPVGGPCASTPASMYEGSQGQEVEAPDAVRHNQVAPALNQGTAQEFINGHATDKCH